MNKNKRYWNSTTRKCQKKKVKSTYAKKINALIDDFWSRWKKSKDKTKVKVKDKKDKAKKKVKKVETNKWNPASWLFRNNGGTGG